MKEDERKLLDALLRRHQTKVPWNADALFEPLGINRKRGYYILEKFDKKGWWMYGVSLRSGYLTENGLEIARCQTTEKTQAEPSS